jgi:methylmalonyl-CoA mutase
MSKAPEVSIPSIDAWTKAAAKSAPGGDVASLNWVTPEGLTVKPLYTRADVDGLPYADTLPGFAPFMRGPQATMYAVRPWTIRQYAGFSTAEESNAFYRKALAAGGQGVSVAFDLATHRGYDSDHPRVTGDVGKAGVAIDSVEDMKILFDGIPLDKISVSMTMNGAVLPILAGYVVAAEEQGVPQAQLSGTIQNDILKEFMVRNTYIYPPEPSMRIIADIIGYTAQHAEVQLDLDFRLPHAGSRRDPGAGTGLHPGRRPRIREDRDGRGMDVDDFAGRLSFFWAIGMNFYLEIAKMRAARLLWWRIMKEFGREPEVDDAAHPLPDLGLVADRAGPLQQRRAHHHRSHGGGVRRHAVAAHQLARRSHRPAHRVQLAHRAQHPAHHPGRDPHHQRDRPLGRQLHDGKADPGHRRPGLGHHRGSRQMGGMTQAVQSGWAKLQIEKCAAEKQARIDSGQDVIVGVNKYKLKEEAPIDILDDRQLAVRESQIARLKSIRASRDGAAVKAALAALTAAAKRHRQPARPRHQGHAPARHGRRDFRCAGKVWGRHRATNQTVSGVYSAAFGGWPRMKSAN